MIESKTSRIFSRFEPVPLSSIPEITAEKMGRQIAESIAGGGALAALFAAPAPAGGLRLFAIMGNCRDDSLEVLSCRVQESWESFTPACPQAHLFEREIAESWGSSPDGHPWFKPVRFHRPRHGRKDAWKRAALPLQPSVMNFYRVEGHEVHEVAVGPVHAGIIEPGHFRFQCHGENVFHLEISLGYQHRGVERRLEGGPDNRTPHYMETLAGDSSIAHALAYAELCETLGRATVSEHAQAVRALALELERLANHTGDLGALAGDVGYLPTQSYCGRLRGDFLNMTAMLCGSRFGRGLVRPGGVLFQPGEATVQEMLQRLESTSRDLRNAVNLLWDTPSVMARFEEIGVVDRQTALALGMVGPAARASGIRRDVRTDYPSGLYRSRPVPLAFHDDGNVFARAWVRWLEIQHSIEFVRQTLESLPAPEAGFFPPASAGGVLAVSLVEGWRGQICHTALTDAQGRFSCYKVIDPSFRNWSGLAMALREQQISDFPLCNKSFNLSYCGHDL